jgi:uncharacterized protein (DUF302 family)
MRCATKNGVNILERASPVHFMAQSSSQFLILRPRPSWIFMGRWTRQRQQRAIKEAGKGWKGEPMIIKSFTDKTVEEAAVALQAAVESNHFGVMQVHNLQETMLRKGVDFAHKCLVFEVCQPQQAKKVLDENMRVSTALPCRISVYEENAKTVLATLKPTTLLAMFNTPQLEAVAQEVEDTIVKIMNEAANGFYDECGPLKKVASDGL